MANMHATLSACRSQENRHGAKIYYYKDQHLKKGIALKQETSGKTAHPSGLTSTAWLGLQIKVGQIRAGGNGMIWLDHLLKTSWTGVILKFSGQKHKYDVTCVMMPLPRPCEQQGLCLCDILSGWQVHKGDDLSQHFHPSPHLSPAWEHFMSCSTRFSTLFFKPAPFSYSSNSNIILSSFYLNISRWRWTQYRS